MADGTNIEWTDATWQIVTGCSVVSPGCANCYAMRLAGTRLQHHHSRRGLTTKTKAGPVWNGQVRFNAGWATQPLQWKKPREIFVAAHGDLFHDAVQRWMLVRVFAVMAMAHWHRFQVLTKRSSRMRDFVVWLATKEGQWEMARAIQDLGICRFYTFPLPNVWLGISAEDQARFDERAEHLAATPAAVRWVSAEPLLGPIDAARYIDTINWIVSGGESGPSARPAHPDWFRSIRDQCAAAGVSYFHKQNGAWAPGDAFGMQSDGPVHDRHGNVRDWMNRYVVCADRADRLRGHSFTEHATNLVYRVGKKRAGAKLDGVGHREFPR